MFNLLKEFALRLQEGNPGIKLCHNFDLPLLCYMEQIGKELPAMKTLDISCYGDTDALTLDYLTKIAYELEINGYEDYPFYINFNLSDGKTTVNCNIGKSDGNELESGKYEQKDGIWIATIPFIMADSLVSWVNGCDEYAEKINVVLKNFRFNLGDVMDLYYDQESTLKEGLEDGSGLFYPTFINKVRSDEKYSDWTWNPDIKDWISEKTSGGAKKMTNF